MLPVVSRKMIVLCLHIVSTRLVNTVFMGNELNTDKDTNGRMAATKPMKTIFRRPFSNAGMVGYPSINRHWMARSCIWPQPYDPDFDFSMVDLFGICLFMAYTGQVWHGETKIWVVRSRSFTWTSPAMLVNRTKLCWSAFCFASKLGWYSIN